MTRQEWERVARKQLGVDPDATIPRELAAAALEEEEETQEEENPREELDDDGIKYADPRDYRDGRE